MKHLSRLFALLVLALATGCVSVVPAGFLSGTSGASSSPASPAPSPAPRRLGAPILTWGGDLAGSTMQSQTVAALHGVTLPTPSGTGTVLTYSGSALSWGAGGGFSAGGDLSGTSTSQTVTGLTGSAGVVTATAGTIKETGSTLSIADSGGVSRAVLDMTHGRITAGGGGSDFLAVLGPDPSLETIAAGLWLLPNGVAASNSNYLLASDGTDSYVNSPSGSGLLHFGAAHAYYAISSPAAWYFGTSNPNAAAPIYLDWTTSTAPTISAGTGATSLTVGTNKSAATLTLQAGDARTFLSSTASGAGTVATTLSGSLALTTRTVTASFTVDTTTTDRIVAVDTTAGSITVTLPAPTRGRDLLIEEVAQSWNSHTWTLARHGTEQINNASASITVSSSVGAGGARVCHVTSVDGTNWISDCSIAGSHGVIPVGGGFIGLAFVALLVAKRRRAANDNDERALDQAA